MPPTLEPDYSNDVNVVPAGALSLEEYEVLGSDDELDPGDGGDEEWVEHDAETIFAKLRSIAR